MVPGPFYAGTVAPQQATGATLPCAILGLLFDVTGHIKTTFADLLAELDLTQPLAIALWQLDPQASPLSLKELAARLACDPSTVTFLAARLESRGLANREVDPANRRVKTLMLTAHGQRVRTRMVTTMGNQSGVGRLTADEQRMLHRLLAKVVSAELPDSDHAAC